MLAEVGFKHGKFAVMGSRESLQFIRGGQKMSFGLLEPRSAGRLPRAQQFQGRESYMLIALIHGLINFRREVADPVSAPASPPVCAPLVSAGSESLRQLATQLPKTAMPD